MFEKFLTWQILKQNNNNFSFLFFITSIKDFQLNKDIEIEKERKHYWNETYWLINIVFF